MSEDTGYGPLDLTVRRFQVAQLAEWALPAVPSGATLAVNGCFRVTVSPARLCLAATDQQTVVFAESPAVRASAEGEFFVPARKLKAILAEAPEGDVTISVKGNTATVTAGSASWLLRLPAPAGYSGLPDFSGVQLQAADSARLLGALSAVRHAVGRDLGRQSFTQVRIAAADGIMYACATDSSQFSRAPVPGFPVSLCIPGTMLDDLVKLLSKSAVDEIGVADSGPWAVFRAGPVTLASLKLAAAFPDVDRLFLEPASRNTMTLGTDKGELAAALRRVRINTDSSTSAVALIADAGELTVTSRDAAGNSAEQALPASWEGPRRLMVVNAEFLAAMLSVHPGAQCTFRVGEPRGRAQPYLVLEDAEAGVTGSCPQMPPALIGYERK